MADNISLSASMRSNLLALQNTSLLQDMTQERLATGKKVNSAIDNPTSYFTAQSLNNRASDLSSRLDGIGQALQTLKAADKALNTLTKLVEQSKALATQASEAASGAVSLTTLEARHATAMSLDGVTLSAGTVANAQWTGINTTATSNAFAITINGGTKHVISADLNSLSTSALVAEIDLQLASEGVDAFWNATSGKIEFAAKEGTTIQIDEGAGNSATTIFGGGSIGAANKITVATPTDTEWLTKAFSGLQSLDSLTFTIKNASGVTATTVTYAISLSTTIADLKGALSVDSNVAMTWSDTSNKLEFTGTAGYKVILEDVVGYGASEIFGGAKTGSSYATTFGTAAASTTVQKNLADFKEVMKQIDQAVSDASYKGKNLLKDSETLTVLFNEDGSSKLDVSGVNFTHKSGLKFSDYSSLNWSDTASIQTSIDEAKTALDEIRAQAQKFGTSNSIITAREDFTKNMVDTLKSGADKLVLADMNEEAANMLALQTQRQLATNSLTMASQSAQGVLQLFR